MKPNLEAPAPCPLEVAHSICFCPPKQALMGTTFYKSPVSSFGSSATSSFFFPNFSRGAVAGYPTWLSYFYTIVMGKKIPPSSQKGPLMISSSSTSRRVDLPPERNNVEMVSFALYHCHETSLKYCIPSSIHSQECPQILLRTIASQA